MVRKFDDQMVVEMLDVNYKECKEENAASVRFFESLADLDSASPNLVEGQRASAQTIGQRLALQVFHNEIADPVLLADVVEMADVGMAQTGNGAGLAIEALLGLGFLGQVFG